MFAYIYSSGMGDRSGDERVEVSTEDSLVKFFSFFENYCAGKPWLFYMYGVYQKYGLLASAARDMPSGTTAGTSGKAHATSTPRKKRKGGGGGTKAKPDSGVVVIKKSKEGKNLEKAKRMMAEYAATGAQSRSPRASRTSTRLCRR